MTSGRRVHERYDRALKVTIAHDDGEFEAVTQNISLGGMYVITEEVLAYGSKVKLSVFLPALKEDVQVEATVRWTKPDGMGVQFGSLRAREVWAFNQLFKESESSPE